MSPDLVPGRVRFGQRGLTRVLRGPYRWL